jgi:hypothetical protein
VIPRRIPRRLSRPRLLKLPLPLVPGRLFVPLFLPLPVLLRAMSLGLRFARLAKLCFPAVLHIRWRNVLRRRVRLDVGSFLILLPIC